MFMLINKSHSGIGVWSMNSWSRVSCHPSLYLTGHLRPFRTALHSIFHPFQLPADTVAVPHYCHPISFCSLYTPPPGPLWPAWPDQELWDETWLGSLTVMLAFKTHLIQITSLLPGVKCKISDKLLCAKMWYGISCDRQASIATMGPNTVTLDFWKNPGSYALTLMKLPPIH